MLVLDLYNSNGLFMDVDLLKEALILRQDRLSTRVVKKMTPSLPKHCNDDIPPERKIDSVPEIL